MLAYATLHGKEKVFDETLVQAKIKAFEGLSNSDLAALMLSLLMDNDLADTFGWLSGDSYKQEASKGAFAAMSQETGNELNGRFTAFQMSNEAISANTKQIAETINMVLGYLPHFEGAFSDMLSGQAITNDHLATIERYTKEIKSFGEILRSIADNTKNL